MNKKSLFAFPIIVGLFLSSCGSEDTATPVIDYLTPLQSMVDNIQKYDGPLTIDLRMSGAEAGQEATYRTISSYDKETHRYYRNSGPSNGKSVFVPEENSKVGMEYFESDSSSYMQKKTYSTRSNSAPYMIDIGELLQYLLLADSPTLLKELEEFYSYAYTHDTLIEGGGDVKVNPLTFTYGFAFLGNKYQFSLSSSRTAETESKDASYKNSIKVIYDKDYLYSIDSRMSVFTFEDGKSMGIEYNRLYEFTLAFDEEGYNDNVEELTSKELPLINPIYDNITYIASGAALYSEYFLPGSTATFEGAKTYLENNYKIEVKGFYLDEEFTQEVTSILSDEYQTNIYVKYEVLEGYTALIIDTKYETIALPGGYLPPELYMALYYDEYLYEYHSLRTVAFNESVKLPLTNINNNYKIKSVTLDDEAYDTYSVSFSSGKEHHYYHEARKYYQQTGEGYSYPIPIKEYDCINNKDGLYLRNFVGSADTWYVVNTSEIVKEDFKLEFKDYSSEHLLTEDNISSLEELDKSGVSVIFRINDEEVTSIPEGYSGDILFRISYSGNTTLHYVLIG